MPDILNCILIDDEPKAIATLSHEIQRLPAPHLHQLAAFTRTQDALDFLSAASGANVDVVFLDIEMPDLNGLAFVDAFPNRTFEVVFITAHSHYAIEAIRKNAFDYLLKPVYQDDLRLVVERLAERRARLKNTTQQEAVHFGMPPAEENTRVSFEVDRKIVFLAPDDIIYCHADGNYCHVFLERDKKLFLTRQLKEVSGLLPQARFLRIHKSYTINLSKVQEYHRVEHYLLLSNGKHIPVSKPMREFFMNRFRS